MHTRRRSLVGIVEGDPAPKLALAVGTVHRPHLDGRRDGVGEADHGAGREVVLGVQAGETVRTGRIPSALRAGRRLLEPIGHRGQLRGRPTQVVVLDRLADGDRADAPQRGGDLVDGQVGRRRDGFAVDARVASRGTRVEPLVRAAHVRV